MYYYVYMITNWANSVLYIGVTNDLQRRILEHKNKKNNGFSNKYSVDRLVYFEKTTDINAAIKREKQLKAWSRKKKDALVSRINPMWKEIRL